MEDDSGKKVPLVEFMNSKAPEGVQELDTAKAEEEVKNEILYEQEAEKIYNEGKSLDFMCNSCSRMHADDANIIRTLFLSCASIYVRNCNGVNIEITGSAGSGKTHIIKVVLLHIPFISKLKAKLSDKALFYHEIHEGTILAYDDQDLSEDMQSTIKNLSWDEPTELRTVKQQSKLTLKIPPRCPYWNTRAEGSGDEQIQDRVIKFWSDESGTHKIRRDAMENLLVMQPHLREEWKHDIDVSLKIWQKIRGPDKDTVNKYTVVVPFANRICGGNGDARTRNLFISLIQASCVMSAPKRKKDEQYGYLIATEEDFTEAASIVNPLMKNIGGSQNQKLNRNAVAVLEALKDKESNTYPFEVLMTWSGRNNVQLNQAIGGRRDDGMDGLAAKCPAIIVTTLSTSKRTIMDKEGKEDWTRTTSSRKGVIWNREIYNHWIRCGTGYYLADPLNDSHMTREEEEYLYQCYLHETGTYSGIYR